MPERAAQRLLAALIVALIAAAAVIMLTSGDEPRDRAYALEQRLRCPTCKTVSIAESPSETAAGMRRIVAQQVAAGRSDAEIIDYFQERYGEWVLLDPPPRGRSLLLWAAPLIVAIGALLLVIFRVRAAPTQERTELSPDEMALVEAAVDQRRRQIGDDVAEDDQP